MIHDYNNDKHHLFYSFDGKSVTQKQMALRHQVDMLCGTYKDASGRLYVFDAEGGCKGPADKAPKPFITFPRANSATPQYLWNNRVVAGFKLTDKGIDIIGKPSANAKTKTGKGRTVWHLVRVNDGNEPWPVVNQRFLSRPMMDALSLEQLKQMLGSIHVHSESPNGGIVWYTDIGEVNQQMLLSEVHAREKAKP